MTHAFHYLHMLHAGNPYAFWFIFGCFVFVGLALCLTPLCDKDFDRYMQEYEEADALAEEFRRAV